MKASVVLLLLFIASGVKKKETCTTRTTRHPQKTIEQQQVQVQQQQNGQKPLGQPEVTPKQQPQQQQQHGKVKPSAQNSEGVEMDQQQQSKENKEQQSSLLYDQKHTETPSQENFEDSHPGKIISCHLLIVGAGAQTVAFVAYFSEMKDGEEFQIRIFEKESKLGPGKPYDDDVQTSEHLLHTHAASGIVQPTVSQNDFTNWLKLRLNLYNIMVSPSARKASPPPRIVLGKYLIARFDQFVKKCNNQNYQVEAMNGTSADAIERRQSGGFAVKLSNNDTVHAQDVVLATGYYDHSRFGDQIVKGYYKSPWPASDLTDPETGISPNAHAAIFGGGLGGIDGTLTLATGFGKFLPNIGKPGFTYKTEHELNLTMYSGSGHLPPVGLLPAQFVFQHFTPYNIRNIKNDNNGRIPMEEVCKLIRDEFVVLQPSFASIEGYSEMGCKELFTEMDKFVYFPATTPVERLKKDIDQARIRPMPSSIVQTFFTHMRSAFNILVVRYLFAEDMIIFKKYIVPKLSKLAVAFPLNNAEKMLALIDAGRLHLVPVGRDNYAVPGDGDEGVWLHYGNNEKVYHRYFVDAVGQTGDIELDTRPLTKSLLDNGLAQKLRIPFDNKTKGEEAFNEEEKMKTKRRKIEFDALDGKYYYKADGIEVNLDTMHVIPPGEDAQSVIDKSSHGVIYATGPFVYGRYQFAQSLPFLKNFAQVAAEDMKSRYFKKPLHIV